jgi:hypothetical protein
MLGNTLANVLNLVKSEVSASLSVGTANDALWRQAIETKQIMLASGFDWSELEDEWDATATALGRYYAFPTTDVIGVTANNINFDRDVVLRTKFSTKWQEVEYGISPEEYRIYDSDDATVSADPVRRWRYQPGNRANFEVWPRPATNQPLRFYGQRVLKTLRSAGVLSPSLTLDLDDIMVALAVSVDLLAGKPDQAAKLNLFNNRFNHLRSANKSRDEIFVLGRRRVTEQKYRSIPIKAIA